MKTLEITETGYRKVKLSNKRIAYRTPNNRFCSSRAFNISKSKTGVITEGESGLIPESPERFRVNVKVANYGESSHKIWVNSEQYIKAGSKRKAVEQAYFRLLSMGFNLNKSNYEFGVNKVKTSGTSKTEWKHKENRNFRKEQHSLREWL